MSKRNYVTVKIRGPYDPNLSYRKNKELIEWACHMMLNSWYFKNACATWKHHFMIQCLLTLEKKGISMKKKVELIKSKYEEVSEE